MSLPPKQLRTLSDDERERFEQIASAFDEAWQRAPDQPPAIEAFLPQGGAVRLAVLIELVRIDLEYRLKQKRQTRVEDYLRRFAELAGEGAAVLTLVAAEYEQRRDEPGVSLEEYLARFPGYGEELRARLENTAGTMEWPTITGYEIEGVIGRGSMGVVYQARHLGLKRRVALKMILAGSHAGPDDRARFRTEAEAVARLQHPHIIQVYDIGEQGGRPFVSLEFVAGGSLAQHLAGAPLPPREAAVLVRTLAEAMQAAHQRGIIHRDLKPANVLLTADGSPKVSDFGLAKQLNADAGQTASGAIMGTPSYMAPEQAEGRTKAVGPAADVYALGAILYEALTGRPPFRGPSMLDTLEQVRTQEPVSPRRLQPKLPRDLETICLKCLEKAPGNRYPTAQDLADDLRHFRNGEPIHARPANHFERLWRWCRRKPLVASLWATLVLVFLVGLGGVLWQWRRAEDKSAEAVRERDVAWTEGRRADANFQLAFDAVDQMLTRVSQDETRLAFEPRMELVRRQLLQDALTFYQRFLAARGTEPAVRWETARAYKRMAEIQQSLGASAPAEEAYGQAIALLQQLADEYPTREEYRATLAGSYLNLGNLMRATRRPQEAEQAYRQARDLDQTLADQFPTSPAYRQGLACSYNNIGLLLQDAGRLPEAALAYRQALDLHQKLANEFPDQPDYRDDLAKHQNNLGAVLEANAQLQEAEQAYRRARELQQELMDRFPANPGYREALAVCHDNLGRVMKHTRPQEAEQLYRQALDLREKLAADFPHVPAYRYGLACSHCNVGDVLRGKRPQAAEQAYRKGLDLLHKLVADFPNEPAYWHDLSSIYCRMGNLLRGDRRPEAEQAYRQAVRLLQELVAKYPRIPVYRDDLAISHANLGDLLRATDRRQEAVNAYREALSLREKLVAECPDMPTHREQLPKCSTNLGILLAETGQLQEAEDVFRRGLDFQQRLVGQFPRDPARRDRLASSHVNLGYLLAKASRPREAEDAYRKAIGLWQQLADESPGVPDYRRNLENARQLLEQVPKR